MDLLDFDSVQVGDTLPSITHPPISRTTLALYAGASGDHNPIHIDSDFARAAGMPDVFAHGMLGMAWLGQLVTNWAPQACLRSFEARFQGITELGAAITCQGRIREKLHQDGEKRVVLEISSVNQDGQARIAGLAVVALS